LSHFTSIYGDLLDSAFQDPLKPVPVKDRQEEGKACPQGGTIGQTSAVQQYSVRF